MTHKEAMKKAMELGTYCSFRNIALEKAIAQALLEAVENERQDLAKRLVSAANQLRETEGTLSYQLGALAIEREAQAIRSRPAESTGRRPKGRKK